MIDQFEFIYYYYEFYYYYGCARMCAGVRGYVCVCGYARVCVGMPRGAQCGRECIGVCKSVWMSVSVCMG